MALSLLEHLKKQIAGLHEHGLYKAERVISSPQQAVITVKGGAEVINLCANNYLGLANHPELIKTAQTALLKYGFGLSSVRFICGTQTVHKELESRLSAFLGTEDTILYSSCFDANGGLFETLLDEQDAVISDALNHASIIDGVRLCKAKRFRYSNNNMSDLEARLKEAAACRFKLIATDGVFSMDGIIANLKGICDLAEKYGALVMVDDSHAVGFMGEHGRGSHEFRGVMDRVDILTGTLGKALGGASGGYTSGRKEIVEWLRQRSRPYLFSNTLAPVIAATSIKVLDLLEHGDALRKKLHDNSTYFRAGMQQHGFTLVGADHPIIPVMLGDAKLAKTMADELLKEGIYVIGFSFPVVPEGKARIRVQVSAAHEKSHLDKAMAAFAKVGKKLKIIH
ncbi:MAG: glycine C-acetyltransferase [Gammaproteobacteria bacterium]|nr:glycine C-acetyltransferase [Gammaproteobacteria bacterium]MBU6510570.1 glycine C-acetyltransferase [Gammaproteobacteria bacterium]MDE1984867.1 glycine C-acetyltransferase [Gammaproteobacteria bacterium]MDE2109463.1 glycine C-acetyltransferase [Gammaproteobacteria bacterium]MDE2459939.1 glycine C-acetyltransferase [Gammaproteobacteria bacterium]